MTHDIYQSVVCFVTQYVMQPFKHLRSRRANAYSRKSKVVSWSTKMESKRSYFDYNQIKTEFLSSVRRSKSFGKIGVELGVANNLFYKWERSLKIFHWQDFIETCLKARVPIADTLARVFCYYGPTNSTRDFLIHLTAGRSSA